MKNKPDLPEELREDIESVFEGNLQDTTTPDTPEKTQEQPEKQLEEKETEKEEPDKTSTEETKETPEATEEKPEEKLEEKPEEKPEAEEKKEEKTEEKAEEKKEESKEEPAEKVSQEETKLLEEMGLQKFKSLKDALEAYKNLESAYGKVTATLASYEKGIIPPEVQEGVQGALNLVSKPRVKFDVPEPTNYVDEEGNLDIVRYLRDVLTDYTVELQKNIVFGQIGSALYTLQKAALMDKYNELEEKTRLDQEATTISQRLIEKFPVLNDEKVFNKVARAWAGEAQLLGRKLEFEDFVRVASEVLGEQPTTPKEEPPVENVGGMAGSVGKEKLSKEEEVVEELFEASRQKYGF
jgi:DNA mismatch repair ATPase MutL